MFKKIISLFVAIIIAFSVFIEGTLFAGAVNTNDYQKDDVIDALNAVLIGVHYDSYQGENDVHKWSDETVCEVIHCKLLWDDYQFSNSSSYLHKAGIEMYTKDRELFNLEFIQKITQDTLGRDFPINTRSRDIYVSGDRVVIEYADGESTNLLVQNYVKQGDRVIAVGTTIKNYSPYSEFAGYFRAEFEVNPSSVYGYTLVSLSNTGGNQKFNNLKANASSELKEKSATHYAKNVLDENLKTAWVEGVTGIGENEWIKLETTDGSKMDISAIEFTLGYHKNQDILQKNGWPSKVIIECDGGYRQETEFYTCEDPSVVAFDIPQKTSSVKITILEAAEGVKYEDTCISEIDFYGIDTADYFSEYVKSDSSVGELDDNENGSANDFKGIKPKNKINIPLAVGIAAISLAVIVVVIIIIFKITKRAK